MKACVVYDSFFGNTAKIAGIIGSTLEQSFDVQVQSVSGWDEIDLKEVQLLVVGSPTRAFEPTKPIKIALQNLKAVDYPHLRIACFDTRMDVQKVNNKILNFFVRFRGYALDTMEKIVKKNGFLLAYSGIGFFVDDSEGPLSGGETDKAVQWANKLLEKVNHS